MSFSGQIASNTRCLLSIIELGIPVLLFCLKGDWVKVQLKMANDDCHFGLLYFEFC